MMNRNRLAALIAAVLALFALSTLTATSAFAGDGATKGSGKTAAVSGESTGKVFVNDKTYTKAEITKMVVEKANREKITVQAAATASAAYQVMGRELGDKSCWSPVSGRGFYAANGTCVLRLNDSCPLAYIRVYWDGYQNYARTDHSSKGTACGDQNTNGIRLLTGIQICRSTYSGCIDPADWDRKKDEGNYTYYAGAVYSGASSNNCIKVHGWIDWRPWYQGNFNRYQYTMLGACG